MPARSRVTVRRTTVAALRRSRAALETIEAELDSLLSALRADKTRAGKRPDIRQDAPERLREAMRKAAAALSDL